MCDRSYMSLVYSAVDGGVTSVQLREKVEPCELAHFGKKMLACLKPLGIPLLINDHVELAKQLDADGVHLGQGDMHPDEARKILGPDKIIGLTIETPDELNVANNLTTIDYVSATAVFPSFNKLCKTHWGVDALKKFCLNSKHPAIAIGGIDEYNLPACMQTGICGVAMIRAIHEADDPRIVSRGLRKTIDEILEGR